MSYRELLAAAKEKREAEKRLRLEKRDAYEGLRADFLKDIRTEVFLVEGQVKTLREKIEADTGAFYDVMCQYGEIHRDGQICYRVGDDTFRVEVKSCRVKKFDERADVAARRLIEFLRAWVKTQREGANDPMYQLAMSLLERNRYGDLDYKSISKLYDLEDRFNDAEYSAIMALFRESNIVMGTATNYYFYRCNELGVWNKIEVSFNRL